MCRILLALILAAFITPDQPPLAVYASLSRPDVPIGGTFSATLSVYSTAPEVLSLELDAPTPTGMTLLATRWSTNTVQFDRPVTITLQYRVDRLPPDGALQTMAYTVKDGAGHLAASWVRIRVEAQQNQRRFLPLVVRSG